MNLTQTAKMERQAIVIFLGSLIIYSVIYFSFPYMKQSFHAIFPVKEKPQTIYGVLPQIKFTGLSINSNVKPEYVLNTKDGRLPNITPQLISVYKVTKPLQSFSGGKNAQTNAGTLGFTNETLVSTLTGSVYKWSDPTLLRNLQINISTNALDYSVDLVNNKARFNPGNINLKSSSPSAAKDILTRLGYFKDPLYLNATPVVTAGKFVENRIVETVTPQEQTFAKVDFFRTIYKVPIYGPSYDDALLQAVIAVPLESKETPATILKYAKIRAYEWSVNTDTFGKYPTKSVTDAWKEVTEGKGAFARLKTKTSSTFEAYQPISVSKISIESVKLAYYDSYNFQQYLQPIYVFDGNFQTSDGVSGQVTIYNSAVNSTYISTSN